MRVVVSGRVQGVWFRQSCKEKAAAGAVAGWVRNRSDGTVEAVVEGEPDAVDKVVDWMRGGPPLADVTSVDVTEEPPTGKSGFRVR